MWPIRDSSGDTIGFGARRIFDDDRIEAKYLNTPETPIYHKSQVLYGIDLARREIARASQAVIVEGYTDVMACHLAGVKTAVATCGTVLRRRPRAGDPPAAARPRRVPRRGDLHLRRRRGRPEGGASARSRVTRSSPARPTSRSSRAGSTRATCGCRRATPRCVSWSPGGCRSTASSSPTWSSATTSTAPTAAIDAMREAAKLVTAIRDRSKVDAFARELAGMLGIEPVGRPARGARAPRSGGSARAAGCRHGPASARPSCPTLATRG